MALLATGGALRSLHPLAHACEGSARVLDEAAACFGQLDTARQSSEQRHAKFALKCPDLMAQRRLLNAEPLGGTGDVPFLSDGDEIA
jgi:hypothetical protein